MTSIGGSLTANDPIVVKRLYLKLIPSDPEFEKMSHHKTK